jgi:hypothetical protein
MMINDLRTRALVIIEPANKASKAVWRRVGRLSRLTWVVRVVWGIVVVVAVLLGGGWPANANDPGDAVRASRRLGTCRCGLAVGVSSGWIRDIQVDFTNRLASRWQGPGAIIPGVAWIGDQRLHWVPGGRLWGGRAFELRAGDIERIQVSSFGVRSTGLVVTTSEHGEAWLFLHRSDAATLLTKLRGHDQLGGRADSA